jgi:transposase
MRCKASDGGTWTSRLREMRERLGIPEHDHDDSRRVLQKISSGRLLIHQEALLPDLHRASSPEYSAVRPILERLASGVMRSPEPSAAHKANEVGQRLATIPGVGPVTALTLAIEIDLAAFEFGRHLAAWAGLTPKEPSTGGKQRMGEISRAGNERLRALLVTGATSVIKAGHEAGQQADDRLVAVDTLAQAAQSRGCGTCQQDGPGSMGADDSRGGVPALGHHRPGGCGMTAFRRVTIQGGVKSRNFVT